LAKGGLGVCIYALDPASDALGIIEAGLVAHRKNEYTTPKFLITKQV